jgi:transcription initiation factor IIF auxiliary subunit
MVAPLFIRLLFVPIVGLVFDITIPSIVFAQDIKVDNTAKYVGNGRYDWTVFIVAEKAVLSRIQTVEYTLHPTFTDPVLEGTGPRFSLTSNGWGEFNIKVKIIFKDKKKPPTVMNYWLKLFAKSKTTFS